MEVRERKFHIPKKWRTFAFAALGLAFSNSAHAQETDSYIERNGFTAYDYTASDDAFFEHQDNNFSQNRLTLPNVSVDSLQTHLAPETTEADDPDAIVVTAVRQEIRREPNPALLINPLRERFTVLTDEEYRLRNEGPQVGPRPLHEEDGWDVALNILGNRYESESGGWVNVEKGMLRAGWNY